jgi:acyl-CoA thioester hydrolase
MTMRAPAFQPVPDEKDNRFVRDTASGKIWHRVSHRVLFADTDRTGAVYHANYFRFFELGRTTLLGDAGYDFKRLENDGLVYPIYQLGSDFFRPLGYNDPIWIFTRFREMQRVRIDFEYLVSHKETNTITCAGFTRHCATNAKGCPVAVDPMTVAIFHRLSV